MVLYCLFASVGTINDDDDFLSCVPQAVLGIGRIRIRPPRFQTEWHKRQQKDDILLCLLCVVVYVNFIALGSEIFL